MCSTERVVLLLLPVLLAASAVHSSLDDNVLQEAWMRAERSLELDLSRTPFRERGLEEGRAFGSPQPKVARREVRDIWEKAEVFARAVDDVCTTQNVSRREAEHLVERAAPRGDLDPNVLCRRRNFNCNERFKYRTMPGFCNNIRNSEWGMAVVRLERLLDAVYGDGLSTPRQSVQQNAELPLARLVSVNCVASLDSPDNDAAHMAMFFGQFLNHDITSTPHRTDLTQCCANQQNDPDCMPIMIPRSDTQYGPLQIGCMEFARSHRACGNGARQQINQNTAFIDGSQIYGSTDSESQALRTLRGGFLRSSANGARLPENANDQTCTPSQGSTRNCFSAGDNRVNENPGLSSLHLLFMREHNRIADILGRQNSRRDDETIFQEARRIVIAQLQNIVYSEFLPLVIGRNVMDDFTITLPRGFTTYDGSINPGIINSFNTAAYRFGHSMIQGIMNTGRSSIRLADNFNNPDVIYDTGAEAILVGGAQQASQRVDNFMTEAVTRQLFHERNTPNGLDLASLNIQRGRDHGLPSYNAFRRLCSLTPVRDFQQLATVFLDGTRASGAFRNTYAHVDDIDLWPALIAESPQDGALLGPVASCLLGTQFNRLMFGDRFFFSHRGQAGSFTQAQLNQLRSRSLASIMCDNMNVQSIQPQVMRLQSNSNSQTSCRNLPSLDLSIFG